MAKNVLKGIAALLAALLLVILIYVAYVLIDYHRIGDQTLSAEQNTELTAKTGTAYTMLTWNIGFCAYSRDYSFFMDGGKYSRAYSKEEVYKNLNGITDRISALDADFTLLQEVDLKATRSYSVNQKQEILQKYSNQAGVFALNYDSSYLFYPFHSPHGKSRAGELTLSKYRQGQSQRVELPIETGLSKFVDLDRCYMKTEIPLENGKTLYVYNLHLSAYTTDGTIVFEQLKLLLADMRSDYARGCYAVAAGDFNKDLLGNSPEVFGISHDANWAKPFPFDMLGEDISLWHGVDAESPEPSCRNCDIGYEPGKTFVLSVDGFMTTPNVTVNSCRVINEQFMHSDHNPVLLSFTLQ